ncbi:hypothetical protein T459_27033 [Capsicum annuum]|uniref:F-box domain-containing protein n=1 Tax=Capsicum annuum TaxID=4072 RepID=A0A2G2YCS3_CAPAN|nr:putative protease 2-like [Capsicum annuum]PHT67546.1 hypothetical protein T459_27033 [Capsicum annuum]
MLNNFPENVIDEILMCLPFRDAVRTSILSTKWRYVWRRLPELMLSHTSWKPEEDLTDLTRAGVPTRLSHGLYCVKHLSISSKDLSDSDEWLLIIFVLLKSSISSESEFRFFFPSVESDDNHIQLLESLEVERFSNVTFNHLREDKLMQTNCIIPEKQLIELLLAKSPELVRMLIVPCLVEEFATVQILAELIRFQRASPNAEVVYNLDKHPNPRPVSFSLARMFSEVDEELTD